MVARPRLLVLWGVYSFRYSIHDSGVSPLEYGTATLSPVARGLIHFCARHHLLPESYLYGLAIVQGSPTHRPAYIFGEVYAHGQWFYFPALLSLKWSVGVLGLLALAVYVLGTGKIRRPREIAFLTLPPAVFLAVAMSSQVNIGIRHVLPVFPFAFLLAGVAAGWLIRQRSRWACVAIALIVWHVTDSLRMFPNYMPYANALWGGPHKTHLYFSDSATDWGQQLKWTRQWLEERHVKECWFAYYPAPFLQPSDYDIPCRLLPTVETIDRIDIAVPPVVHGPVLVSYSVLNGFGFGSKVRNPYQVLFERKPDAVIADGVAVFNGDFALPVAAALLYERRSSASLKTDPQAALRAAESAIALAPNAFDANMALGDALAAAGDRVGAAAAYATAMRLAASMEPGAQALWRPVVEAKIAAAGR